MLKILVLAATFSMTLYAANNPIAPYHVEKDPQLVVEPDQTDIFAIPLDEDAEDQQMELYQLEHPAKGK
jgi:hypothetical protein